MTTLSDMLQADMALGHSPFTQVLPLVRGTTCKLLPLRSDALGYRIVQFAAAQPIAYVGIEYPEGIEWVYRLRGISKLDIESTPPLSPAQLSDLFGFVGIVQVNAHMRGGGVRLPSPDAPVTAGN